MHLLCAEAYVVVAGTGAVETLSPAGAAVTPLEEGDVVWYTPGVVHRSINSGDLKVIAVMQNSGLPEAGDAVMTFPAAALTSPEAYSAAASLAPTPSHTVEQSARARRDLAMTGFDRLKSALEKGDRQPLLAFYRAAAALVAPRIEAWRRLVTEGPLAQAAASLDRLDELADGETAYLEDAMIARIPAPSGHSYGMCGTLRAYDPIREAGEVQLR
ncbi:cupin [Gryllotalpicola protaetiae]|uniref:Cupin n=2 Tax=Gryllotalpicola protaetiae TaxID=2419771 RepID=A0A387BW67_9MICO|nr:cupin [Gryllotalpicola protaetiae]